MIQEAIIFATEKHKNQYRKGLKIPYIVHPIEVMQILKANGADDTTLIVGLLHDTVEDTETSLEEIRQKFGAEVALLVACESEIKGLPYRQRKQEHMARIACAPLKAKLVNCADKLSNIKNMLIDFRREGDPFFENFNGSKADIKWYYSIAIQALSELDEYAIVDGQITKCSSRSGGLDMYNELKATYDELFSRRFVNELTDADINNIFSLCFDSSDNNWYYINEIVRQNNQIIINANSVCDYSVRLIISDFNAEKIVGKEVQNEQNKFLGYMYEKFGEEYKNDFMQNKFLKTNNLFVQVKSEDNFDQQAKTED